jgi:hypothetical protein
VYEAAWREVGLSSSGVLLLASAGRSADARLSALDVETVDRGPYTPCGARCATKAPWWRRPRRKTRRYCFPAYLDEAGRCTGGSFLLSELVAGCVAGNVLVGTS